MKKFVEDKQGVHLLLIGHGGGEHTLCGDGIDSFDTEPDWENGVMSETSKRVVTCPRCIALIKLCRGVKVSN